MTRHLNDQTRTTGSGRLRAYLRHEREAGMHPAIAKLLSRPKDGAPSLRKVREYARIELGRLA